MEDETKPASNPSEAILNIRCGVEEGKLYTKKFGPGGTSRCIEHAYVNNLLLNPIEFSALAGKASSWKLSIKADGKNLQNFIDTKILTICPRKCACVNCEAARSKPTDLEFVSQAVYGRMGAAKKSENVTSDQQTDDNLVKKGEDLVPVLDVPDEVTDEFCTDPSPSKTKEAEKQPESDVPDALEVKPGDPNESEHEEKSTNTNLSATPVSKKRHVSKDRAVNSPDGRRKQRDIRSFFSPGMGSSPSQSPQPEKKIDGSESKQKKKSPPKMKLNTDEATNATVSADKEKTAGNTQTEKNTPGVKRMRKRTSPTPDSVVADKKQKVQEKKSQDKVKRASSESKESKHRQGYSKEPVEVRSKGIKRKKMSSDGGLAVPKRPRSRVKAVQDEKIKESNETVNVEKSHRSASKSASPNSQVIDSLLGNGTSEKVSSRHGTGDAAPKSSDKDITISKGCLAEKKGEKTPSNKNKASVKEVTVESPEEATPILDSPTIAHKETPRGKRSEPVDNPKDVSPGDKVKKEKKSVVENGMPVNQSQGSSKKTTSPTGLANGPSSVNGLGQKSSGVDQSKIRIKSEPKINQTGDVKSSALKLVNGISTSKQNEKPASSPTKLLNGGVVTPKNATPNHSPFKPSTPKSTGRRTRKEEYILYPSAFKVKEEPRDENGEKTSPTKLPPYTAMIKHALSELNCVGGEGCTKMEILIFILKHYQPRDDITNVTNKLTHILESGIKKGLLLTSASCTPRKRIVHDAEPTNQKKSSPGSEGKKCSPKQSPSSAASSSKQAPSKSPKSPNQAANKLKVKKEKKENDSNKSESTDKTSTQVRKQIGMTPKKLKEPLATICKAKKLSRKEALQKVWSYIHTKKLLDPNDKSRIICDANLRKLTKSKAVTSKSLLGFVKNCMEAV